MNVFDLLKEDHQKVAQLFDKLESTTERAVKTREELFAKLHQELSVHAQAEEEILYPVLKEASKTRELTFEAFEEHKVIKQLLEEMAQLPKDQESWTAKFSVLMESVDHHVKEEEDELFEFATDAVSKEEAEELGARIESRKLELVRDWNKSKVLANA